MPSAQRPCVILSRRRTGAGDIHNLLGSYVPWHRLGPEPFFWSRPLGEVSKRFHAKDVAQARELLLAELARGVFFKHQYETESWEFNSLLLQMLEACRYRVVRFEREDEAERLFSMVISSHFSTWARDGIDGLRERLRRREPAQPVDLDHVRKLVREEAGYKRWFDAEYGKYQIDTLSLSYEAFFRRGLRALPLADELFAFAGLGSRVSLLDDASLLRFIFSGEHYTLGLLEYSEDLRQVHAVIMDELANPSPPSPPRATLQLVSP